MEEEKGELSVSQDIRLNGAHSSDQDAWSLHVSHGHDLVPSQRAAPMFLLSKRAMQQRLAERGILVTYTQVKRKYCEMRIQMSSQISFGQGISHMTPASLSHLGHPHYHTK